jgi:hypothetical protein
MHRPLIATNLVLSLVLALTGASRGDDVAGNPPKAKHVVAAAMHPMWLIIKEDTVCAERTPPWGAPSVEEYSKRLDRNLKLLESNPQAQLNYDFSASELEDMKAMYPGLGQRIRAAIERGQLGIINGTYSQPHLHTLSLEASVRQFAMGNRSIFENFGYRVRTYAMQEPGYTDQTPQILRAFGYRYGHRVLSEFTTRQQPLPGQTIAGNEAFCLWTGLDGTTIPAMQPATGVEAIAPDMEEFVAKPDCRYVTLDAVEDQKMAEWHGPLPKMRMYIPWGYIEGTNADELPRLSVAAETALVQMETVAALTGPAGGQTVPPRHTAAMWKTWLLAQHHDAYWSGGPELRAKSCGRLKDVVAKSSKACAEMLNRAFPSTPGGKNSLLLFAVYPNKHRGVAMVPWTGRVPVALRQAEGKSTPVQVVPTGPNKGRLLVPFAFRGAGYKELIRGDSAPAAAVPESIASNWEFKNPYYAVGFRPDGSIRSIRTARGTSIFEGRVAAAEISASVDGKPAHFEATANTASRWRGPVADVVESAATLGTFPAVRRILLYHDLPWFEMEIECRFKNTSIGDFYDDTTKLTLQWPLEAKTSMVQGIGGGAIAADEPATVIYPVNWLDLAHDAGGLSIINFGTLKHLRRGEKLYIVLAWGGNTAHFGNRVYLPNGNWFKALDLRLQGTQTFRFAFYPHERDWRAAGVPELAASLLRPPVAACRLTAADARPTDKTLLAIDGNLVPTSVYVDGNRLVCRVYETYGKKPTFSCDYLGQSAVPRTCDVADKPADGLRAWGIANLTFGRSSTH